LWEIAVVVAIDYACHSALTHALHAELIFLATAARKAPENSPPGLVEGFDPTTRSADLGRVLVQIPRYTGSAEPVFADVIGQRDKCHIRLVRDTVGIFQSFSNA
jgi:hypothetical protein